MKTTVYFVRHAEPNYENHDDLMRGAFLLLCDMDPNAALCKANKKDGGEMYIRCMRLELK